ncbi:ubiquitin specific protease 1 [Haematobia irritans]|uniref:ubiquitin specific protease 1 n=1 Tax=Haematobia irritans TaxID=7368 RepID=UPI003F50D47B
MPRNAAKKANKNTKSLPILVKRNINNNNKTKNTKNNNQQISLKEYQQETQEKKVDVRTTADFVDITTRVYHHNKNSDDDCDVNSTTILKTIPSTLCQFPINSQCLTTTLDLSANCCDTVRGPTNQNAERKNISLIPFDDCEHFDKAKLESKGQYGEDVEQGDTIKSNILISNRKDESAVCFENKNIARERTIEPVEVPLELSSLSTIKTESATSSSSVSATSTLSLHPPSTLYPIVIETHISTETQSLPGYLNKKTTTTTTTTALEATKTKHSISNVTNCNTTSTKDPKEKPSRCIATITNNTETNTAVDTLLKQQKEHHQQQQQLQEQEKFENKTSPRRRKRRLIYQPHEVKARLETLRTRKPAAVAVTDNQNKRQQQKDHKDEDISQKPLAEEIGKKQNDSDDKYNHIKKPEGLFTKRVFPKLDEATLNRIETLSDNEVKKPPVKRKRNQAAALLGFNIQPARSRRATATAQAAVIVAAAVDRTVPTLGIVAGGQRQSTGGDFLKPLPIETGNTNSKKRPRIMSLYERPYQTASDGRGGGGSVVSNGYMSTSRSSSSGGGGSGTPMVMSDSNDSQDMANQYYLSGSSGSGIAGNSSALLGNGSAINHAPTMGTLCNIGNTCYLNSVVYTLRFAPQFLHNLHHLLTDLNALQQNIARARAKSSSLGRGISAVHIENARSWSSKDLASMEQYATNAIGGLTNAVAPTTAGSSSTSATTALTQVTQKSSHQLLTEKLHELYQSLYRNEMNESTEPHHADTLLHAIQDVSSIFEGNQQQDAHEFLMCLLNSIRETNQTLIKAIAECPDVILNGYISNPDDVERDMKQSNVGSGGNNSTSSTSMIVSSLTSNSKSSLFFSRKSKRKDETKNSKNSRLQSPLKDNQITGNSTTTHQSNSLFYLNSNDLNSSASTSPPSAGAGTSIISPSNSTSAAPIGGSDDVDATSTPLTVLLKDKQRLEGKIRELGLDFFNDDFEGITVSTTKCLSCETITEQKETMIDIAVPVPQAGYESNEYMDRPSSFIQNSCITREYFRNENKYRCEQCCGYTEAIRSISYEVLPRLLIIQLSRFSGGMEKINSYIPTSFTLQCFCSKCCELSDANKLHIYKLYSVITHVGATMSVGHYIAYTCSLDWANEYINCPKEQRRRASQERAAAAAAGTNGGGGNSTTTSGSQQQAANSQANAPSMGSSSSTTSFMKIMKFARNKASSSGDMSKNVKHLNGLTTSSKAITNGIGKLTMNNSASGNSSTTAAASSSQCSTTCPSINCCAMRLTAQQQLNYLHSSQNNASEFSEDATAAYSNGSSAGGNYATSNYNNNMHQSSYTASSSNTSGYGSTGRGATKASYASQIHNGSEPIWYMCDDDKIKAMTQREFEELLSPARKITITPYLLFYARYNLQTSSPPKSAATSSSPGPVTSSPQASWSNESLQSSGHSGGVSGGGNHSGGMRM